jgi:hypothetical protein
MLKMVKLQRIPLILRMNYDYIFLFLRTLKIYLRFVFNYTIQKNKAHEQNYIITYCWNHELGCLG